MREDSKQLFDRIAVLYEKYAEINDDVYRPYLRRTLPDKAERAIDLGCGSGRFTEMLADISGDVLAVDVAARELEIARAKRSRPNIEYRNSDLFDITPERDGRFDVLVSVNTLFHTFAEHDRSEVLRHVRSLVAPGGHAIVIDVVVPGPRSDFGQRLWGIGETARVLRRRRSLADAWTVLRLRQHPVWMEHARRNHPMSRLEFHSRYAECFPGAVLTDSLDPFICAMHWHAP